MVSVRIPLTQGKFARVSIEDAERVLAHKWCVHRAARTTYAKRAGKQGRAIMMHNEIAGPYVDHKNRNGLDNRRSNLRPATWSQQSMNQGIHSHNTSGHTGVSFHKRLSKWCAYITVDQKRRHLGHFERFEDAVSARQQAEEELFGEFSPQR